VQFGINSTSDCIDITHDVDGKRTVLQSK